jgi:hypothetical protein
MVAVMSDIGLKGVAGLIMLLAAGGAGMAALIAGIAVAALVRRRWRLTFAQALLRYAIGPLVTVLICLGAVVWAWDGPTDLVDKVGPGVALGSVALGIAVMLVVRFAAVTKAR